VRVRHEIARNNPPPWTAPRRDRLPPTSAIALIATSRFARTMVVAIGFDHSVAVPAACRGAGRPGSAGEYRL